tara:strand:- start:18 stop:140 length:123 start_codon:yes stop_codon:yes gene_type:complete
MVEALIKIAGSLFVGGIGLALIVAATLIAFVLLKELVDRS